QVSSRGPRKDTPPGSNRHGEATLRFLQHRRDLRRGLLSPQVLRDSGYPDHPGDPGERLEVERRRVGRRKNEKYERDRHPIRRKEVDPAMRHPDSEEDDRELLQLAVRNRDTLAEIG